MRTTIGIGLLGAGTVGGTLLRRLVGDHEAILAKTGLDLQVRRVAVRDPAKARSFELPAELLTTDPRAVVEDPGVDLVVEVMGGREPAGELVAAALAAGKPVVTANKELIADRGAELIELAAERGVPLLFEAAVGGGIPIIRPLSETLAGEQIRRVAGIVNGTTNFVLTRMTEEGAELSEALAEAQRLGYAEADPTADVDGHDAAAKAAILASLAFGVWVPGDRVDREGIGDLDRIDVVYAAKLGYVVKLLAIAERVGEVVSARVHPAMVPVDHPLASIRGATNAIFIEGPSIDELLFAGPGAGGEPTASAVLGDVIDAARETLAGAQVAPRIRFGEGSLVDPGSVETKWYVRLDVEDRPGVLAQVAGAFGDADVSIEAVWQEGTGEDAVLLIVTHRAPERAQRAAVAALEALEVVRRVGATIRVQSDGP
ncbi:MAG TPA: homoserine dehydrogenase [Actinobacteria bacterium]|nr:homoserine dehydrogenase [Actinomycetota bacterium]